MPRTALYLLFGAMAATGFAQKPASLRSAAPEQAEVYLIEPRDGQCVASTFTVKFGLRGMGVAPAGVDREATGHHHLLINLPELPDMSLPLPATDSIRHYGAGQTETEITLPPGEHTLQLLLANYLHIPHIPPVISKKITVTVPAAPHNHDHNHRHSGDNSHDPQR